MNPELKAAMDAQLATLRAAYLEQLPLELAVLKKLAENLDGSETDHQHLDELHHRLHKLAGSGGTFGLAALSAAARELEYRIKDRLASGQPTADGDRNEIITGIIALSNGLCVGREEPASISLPDQVLPAAQPAGIWLIDSDRQSGEELIRQLESFNYNVRQFTSIALAEEEAATNLPDLVLLCTEQEDHRGQSPALSRSPRLLKAGRPLLFISAHDDFSSRVEAAHLGALGYFLKPLDIPQLVGRITRIFDQQLAPPPRVLIVDDDTELAGYLRLVLLAAGMEAEVLLQPKDIMEKISAFRPDLILMDMYMPEVSGPDLAGVIRQHETWSSLPIVYLSAETDLDQQIAALNRGADDFLTKPISDPQLVATVRVRVERARQLEELISRDSLTGLLKHASIKDAAEMEIHRAHRNQTPICLAMLDIDHFKQVNDNYGHATGDVVISSVAMLLRQRLRKSDIVGRYGGEEFVAVLPECAGEAAMQLLEEIRASFSAIRFSRGGKDFSCTISAGLVCSVDYPEANSEELLIRADEALYAAKNGGRNRVHRAAGSTEGSR